MVIQDVLVQEEVNHKNFHEDDEDDVDDDDANGDDDDGRVHDEDNEMN